MERTLKIITISAVIFLLFLIYKVEFYPKNASDGFKQTLETEECTAVIVTGTHAKDGRSILMKNRDWSDSQYQKPYFYTSYAGGNYSYILMYAYSGMNEAGLAIMNTLQSCPGLKVWHYDVRGNYTNDKSVAMQYVLSHFSDVEQAVMWLVYNTYGLCDCIGIIGQNSSIGAFVWIDGNRKYITWVNNSHDAAANNWVPNGVYGSRGARAKSLLDQIYNEKGYISWEDVVQKISRDQYDREKTNDNCYSYSDCISRDITRASMVAVSGNNKYDGKLNAMWLSFGENPQIGLFLPLMPGIIDSYSDIPSVFIEGNGLGGLVETKRIYARDGCDSAQWNGTRVREIHNYSFFAESYTFKKYDELLNTIPSNLSYNELKTLLKNYMNDSITFATNIYISERISGDFPPSCSISSIIETSDYAYTFGNSLWYNTGSSGDFIVNITASDDNGIIKVNFPDTVSVGGDDLSSPYYWTYHWDIFDSYSGLATITVYDSIGQTGNCNFNVIKDTTAPKTSTFITGEYTITLSCSDVGAGCNKTYYCIDSNNSCLPNILYTNPINTSCTNRCYVRFYSIDNVNNVETINSRFFGNISKNVVLNFNFNESSGSVIHDLSGYNNNGIIFDASWIKGKHNFALQFDGINDYVKVPHSNYITGFSSGFSVSFWAKFNDTNKRQAILNKYNTSNNQRGWFVEYQNHSTYGKVLGFFASPDGVNYSEWFAFFNPQIDRWYHIAIVWEADKIPRFYVDGKQLTTINNFTISQIYNNTETPLYIGRSYASGREFNGAIDELKIYDSSLNSIEINNIYLDENQNIFSGTLTDKYGTPLQALVYVNSQYTTTKNGEYFLKINSGIYDIFYNFTEFYYTNFFVKFLNFSITSDFQNLLNNVTAEENKISFIVDASNTLIINIRSYNKPNKLKINGIDIPYDDFLSSIPSWNYDSTNKTITVKFSC